VTDDSSTAKTVWTGNDGGEIVASAGAVSGRATVVVFPPDTVPAPPTPQPPPLPEPPPDSGPPIPALAVQVTADSGQVLVNGGTTIRTRVSGLNAGESVIAYQWDFTNNGSIDATTLYPDRDVQYTQHGLVTTKVSVTTNQQRTGSGTVQIVVHHPFTSSR
jgi:hypothetical protein